MASPEGTIHTPVYKVMTLPSYFGIVIAFGHQGDVYIVNVFRMQLLKHLSLDVSTESVIKFLEPKDDSFFIVTGKQELSVWRCPLEHREFDIQTVCEEEGPSIDIDSVEILDYIPASQIIAIEVKSPTDYSNMVVGTKLTLELLERSVERKRWKTTIKYELDGHHEFLLIDDFVCHDINYMLTLDSAYTIRIF